MNYKDSLTKSFSTYLNNWATLLQIVSDIIVINSKMQMCMPGETEGKQLVEDEFFRTLNIGISRVKYYQKKMEDVDVIELDMVKKAQAEMEPFFKIVKERMQTLE